MGIRAILLVIAFVLVGIWVLSVVMKIAGALIHFVLIVALVLIVAAFVKRKVRSR